MYAPQLYASQTFINVPDFLGCCIYNKPKKFGESSSDEDSDDDHDHTEHCQGHVEKRTKAQTEESTITEMPPAVPDPIASPSS